MFTYKLSSPITFHDQQPWLFDTKTWRSKTKQESHVASKLATDATPTSQVMSTKSLIIYLDLFTVYIYIYSIYWCISQRNLLCQARKCDLEARLFASEAGVQDPIRDLGCNLLGSFHVGSFFCGGLMRLMDVNGESWMVMVNHQCCDEYITIIFNIE